MEHEVKMAKKEGLEGGAWASSPRKWVHVGRQS